MKKDGPERCVWCGARAVRGRDGRINWMFTLAGLAATGPHEHKLLELDTPG